MDTCWIRRPSIKSIIIAFTTLMIMPVTGCDKLASNSLPNVDQEDINQLNDSTPTAAPTQNIIENQKAILKQKNLYVWDDAFVPDDKIEENVATAFASANYMMKVIDPSVYNKSEDKVKFAKGFFAFCTQAFHRSPALSVSQEQRQKQFLNSRRTCSQALNNSLRQYSPLSWMACGLYTTQAHQPILKRCP